MSARPTPSWLFRSSALAIGVALVAFGATAPVHPQSFNGTGTLASGDALITESAGATTVTLNSSQAVLNWTPNDTATGGGAIDFQSAGTTATFQGSSNFAVLNRIVPADPSRPVQFNGTVNSLIGSATGGTVYFYSPGGIILGASASFDVGALGLSTADPVVDPSTGAFIDSTGKVIYNAAVPGTGVVINNGAQISAPVDQSSYVAVFAPYIRQDGHIDVNGSTALVAAEAGTITWNNGLFDVQVTTGTDGNAGVAIEHSGFTGGSTAGTAGTDRQRVYLVAVPKNTAITTLIAGGSQLGFDVAGAADVDGNKVILTAGYDVSGDSMSVSSGAGTGTADIVVTNSSVTSALTLTALNNAAVQAVSGGTTSLASDLLVQALGTAQIISDGTGSSVQVNGTVSLTSDNVGLGPDLTGGTVRVRANNGGAIAFGASLSMSASGTGGDDPAGAGTGGLAELLVGGTGTGSSLSVTGVVQLLADGTGGRAFGGQAGLGKGGTALVSVGAGGTADFQSDVTVSAHGTGGGAVYSGTGGEGRGGTATVQTMASDAVLTFDGQLNVDASGEASGVLETGSGAGGNGFGGDAQLQALAGALTVTGATDVRADGTGGNGDSAHDGFGGLAQILADGAGQMTLTGDVTVSAQGIGADGSYYGSFSIGGNGTGGNASIVTASTANGALIALNGGVVVDAGARGGTSPSGGPGGAATGGTAAIATNAANSAITVGPTSSGVTVQAAGNGGTAYGGLGGDGTGGIARIDANGGTVSISPVASVDASGSGGYTSSAIGGTGTGGLAAVTADAGGVLRFDSLQTPGLTLRAVGFGASIEGSGSGGKGVSGTTQILAANGASITVQTDVSMDSSARGGSGANGGDADGSRDLTVNPLGSTVLVNANGGTIAVGGALNIASDSNGGQSFTQGGNGGAAHGGSVIVLAQAGASGPSAISLGSLTVSVNGTGGDAYSYGGSSSNPIAGGIGGAGAGGYVLLSGSAGNVSTGQDNGLLSTGNVSVTAIGSGGSGGMGQDNGDIGPGADGGAGGNAVGGTVRIGAGSSILGPSATGGGVFGSVNVTVGASGGLGGNGGAGLLSGVNGNGGNGGSAVVTASRADASQFFAAGASVTADDVSFSLIAQGGGGGDGTIGGVGGDATAGEIDLILDTGASSQRGNLTLTSFIGTATATGGSGAVSGGSYYGSGPVVSLQHGDATIDSIQMTVSADGPSSFIATPEARLYMRDSTLNASSSFTMSTPGNISVFADSATLSTSTLGLQAGDFVADAGGVAPTNAGTLSADTLSISTNNNIIMSAGLATSSQLFLNAPGEISVYGLNSPSSISLSAGGAITINGVASAPTISLTSSDITIGTGGRLDAGSTGSVELYGTNSAGMRIGDTSFGGGYILDRAEFSRISSGQLSVYTLLTGLPVDMTIGDIDISAGQAGATLGNPDGAVTFSVGAQTQGYYTPAGTIRVTGSVRANGFSTSNALVFADRTTEVDAERGLIEITSDSTGTLGGTIRFLGDRLHVAQAAILDRLEQDPYYAGRADDINTPLPVARPAGVVRAYNIDLSNAVGVLVQNTGSSLVPAGITFFANGPIWSPMMESPGIVEYIINGQLITSSGMMTGIAVHDFLADDKNRNAFAEGSTINGCLVTTVDCPNPAASVLATGLGLPDFIDVLSTPALGGPDPVFDESPSEEEEAAAGKSSPIPPPTPLIFTGPLNPPISVDEPVSGSGNPAFIGGAPASNNAGRGNQ
jgi:filamentous hemagglutinin family protein